MADRKELKCRVTEEEFERFRQVVFERRATMQSALMDALQLWYSSEGVPAQQANSPFGPLTKQEEAALRGVLAYLRDKPYPPEREVWVKAIEALAKRYPR